MFALSAPLRFAPSGHPLPCASRRGVADMADKRIDKPFKSRTNIVDERLEITRPISNRSSLSMYGVQLRSLLALWMGAILAHCSLKDRNEAIPIFGGNLLNGLHHLGLALRLCTGECGGQGLARYHILGG